MRARLAGFGVLACAGCGPFSCNLFSRTAQTAYATEISVGGRKALEEAGQQSQAGSLSTAMSTLAAWGSRWADVIKRIERDVTLTPANRKALVCQISALRETVYQMIRMIGAGDLERRL